MKINEIIKSCRQAAELTQEQVANYLGVSTPAVNKWEKGTSYPDITLLPALARLLGTDLNTLLSFKDELSQKEIALFVNQLSETADSEGFEAAYTLAIDKIKEFPTCYPLLLNTALILDGLLMLYNQKDTEDYAGVIEKLYERVLSSEDTNTKNSALSLLISKYMNRKEYDKAEELLSMLPDENAVDKLQLKANLHIAKGELNDAASLSEQKLLSATTEIHAVLMTLMEISIKENRIEDAEYIADISEKFGKLFDLWEYNAYVGKFQLYSALKEKDGYIRQLKLLLDSVTNPWDLNSSPLYRHIPPKPVEKAFGPKFKKTLIQSLKTDEDSAFLRDCPEFQALLKAYGDYKD